MTARVKTEENCPPTAVTPQFKELLNTEEDTLPFTVTFPYNNLPCTLTFKELVLYIDVSENGDIILVALGTRDDRDSGRLEDEAKKAFVKAKAKREASRQAALGDETRRNRRNRRESTRAAAEARERFDRGEVKALEWKN
ncbi:MAG: hypothetical protein M1840_000801 [Geoglossum simile]|nr:MAG: hypothetical protein M1840_000801 [Geoglossum simile]